ncbi:serine protease snake [Drosophila obscura]|uniref:serine protease snake n=1 Tax=Drosophila obscura TaxID=7282 RepID=UPI001BB0EE9D|nr:serine protease snake [Drosophila obscura]
MLQIQELLNTRNYFWWRQFSARALVPHLESKWRKLPGRFPLLLLLLLLPDSSTRLEIQSSHRPNRSVPPKSSTRLAGEHERRNMNLSVLLLLLPLPLPLPLPFAAGAKPAISPLSQRGIIFPKESFDDCFLDDARQLAGSCKLMQDCPPALKRWLDKRESPKTCYFVKFDHYICCEPDKQPLIDTTTTTTERPTLPPLTSPKKRPSVLACYDYNNVIQLNERDITFVVSVVGGKPTAYREFPYMAALGWRSNFDERIYYRCGGALISPTYVLTAAHCIDFGGALPSQVRLGGDNLTLADGEDFNIKRVVIHPEYNATAAYNDIALLELQLNDQLQAPSLRPTCLWSEHELADPELIAIGYGQTRFAGLSSSQLLKVPLQHVDNEQCQIHYPAETLSLGVVATQLCAGDVTRQRDTCQGDSGGPLIMQNGPIGYVVGITSLGQGCASGPPSVYTRVSSFVSWIEGIVWPERMPQGPAPEFDLRGTL